MKIIKANRLAILISVFFFAVLVFFHNFTGITPPLFSFDLQAIGKLDNNLGNLPINLISSYYNSILKIEAVTTNLSIIIQYGLPAYILIFFFVLQRGNIDKREKFERGGEKINAKNLRNLILKAMKKKGETHRLEIGKEQIPLPKNEENRKFLILAKAGAGKTQAIFSLLFKSKNKAGIKDFAETMIVYERKGTDFIPKLLRRKTGCDYLFDPRDKQGIKWDIFKDLLTERGEIDEALMDFYVSSIIPISQGNSAHFDKQAQSVLKAVLLKIAGSEKPSNKALIDFILAFGNLVDLRNALKEDETVKKYGMDNNVINSLTTDRDGVADGQGSSVMATLNDTFKKLSRREFYFDNGNFSIREFINSIDKNPDKRLFIANTTESAGSFNLYFSLFFNLIFRFGLALKNNSNRRVWLIWDEIQSIGSNGNHALGEYVISEFINFLAESRSKGFCEIVATQSLPQLEKLIKKEGVRSLYQLLSSKILGQYDENEGQKFICQSIGEQEIKREKESESQGIRFNDSRTNTQEEEKIKKIILESELSSLPPLNFFLKIGSYPITQIEIEYNDPKDITQVLIERPIPFFEREDILKLQTDFKNRNKKEEKIEEKEEIKTVEIEEIEKLSDYDLIETQELSQDELNASLSHQML
ncbi:type IV secretion system DNA-binding domain-containing protein [Aliarcobacter cryaerophilus]|uniref:type IV secretion system DNA-binding domain-containing protein n=1 Tax=Aliarcobacter cryaerophilus TaxID=28198 RepID=UPI0021B1BB13|nr:type IV secretion system DNA-binding domain-containing protein [Aliarcobacter cryaerophilus]MCT7505443.1 type IV secretion system DNA-binding domain-containing protein [Aliarcobacter cryaerophilus]